MNRQGKHDRPPQQAPRLPANRRLILLCAGLIVLCASFAIWLILQKTQPSEVSVEMPSFSPAATQTAAPQPLGYLAGLYAQNQDLAGWVRIEGTHIDNPVLYTYGKDYYLYRGFDQKDSTAGSIYIDKRNVLSPRDDNLLLHGHNMKNDTMFHDLLLYRDYDFYAAHKTIRFDTLYEEGTYEVMAAFVSQVYNKEDDVFKYYQFLNAEDEAAFDSFVDNVKALSLYDTGVDASYGDELLTLSTCEYSRPDGRMVVVAKRVR